MMKLFAVLAVAAAIVCATVDATTIDTAVEGATLGSVLTIDLDLSDNIDVADTFTVRICTYYGAAPDYDMGRCEHPLHYQFSDINTVLFTEGGSPFYEMSGVVTTDMLSVYVYHIEDWFTQSDPSEAAVASQVQVRIDLLDNVDLSVTDSAFVVIDEFAWAACALPGHEREFYSPQTIAGGDYAKSLGGKTYCACPSGWASTPFDDRTSDLAGTIEEQVCSHTISKWCYEKVSAENVAVLGAGSIANLGELTFNVQSSVKTGRRVTEIAIGDCSGASDMAYPSNYWNKYVVEATQTDDFCTEEFRSTLPINRLASCGITPLDSTVVCTEDSTEPVCQGLGSKSRDTEVTAWYIYVIDLVVSSVEPTTSFTHGSQGQQWLTTQTTLRTVTSVPKEIAIDFGDLIITSAHSLEWVVIGQEWVPGITTPGDETIGFARITVKVWRYFLVEFAPQPPPTHQTNQHQPNPINNKRPPPPLFRQTILRWPYEVAAGGFTSGAVPSGVIIEDVTEVIPTAGVANGCTFDGEEVDHVTCNNNCFDDVETFCEQNWIIEIQPEFVCSIDGAYSFNLDLACRDSVSCTTDTAVVEYVQLDGTEICSVVFVDDTASVSATLTAYTSDSFAAEDISNEFYLGTTVYFKVVVTSEGYPIDNVEVRYAVAVQDSASSPAAVALDFVTPDMTECNQPTEDCFAVYLVSAVFSSLAQGDTDTYVIMATVEVEYNDGSRKRSSLRESLASQTNTMIPSFALRVTNDPSVVTTTNNINNASVGTGLSVGPMIALIAVGAFLVVLVAIMAVAKMSRKETVEQGYGFSSEKALSSSDFNETLSSSASASPAKESSIYMSTSASASDSSIPWPASVGDGMDAHDRKKYHKHGKH